jgi:hypothetical protein
VVEVEVVVDDDVVDDVLVVEVEVTVGVGAVGGA